ncbi:hypothetical protein HPP92_020448 [Vanilla planifolia]|uniref:Uncharacterized protein n=1 Tax=Vanilla planifolia TaxID=51239 RepID=A0A835Q2U1_VANPL|nr:hypothetical protein HPP92_020832 [Vanilla planifolia]KAG0461972.1 hypothetical protein HPP92_020448 [Vanilla planifolia]
MDATKKCSINRQLLQQGKAVHVDGEGGCSEGLCCTPAIGELPGLEGPDVPTLMQDTMNEWELPANLTAHADLEHA